MLIVSLSNVHQRVYLVFLAYLSGKALLATRPVALAVAGAILL